MKVRIVAKTSLFHGFVGELNEIDYIKAKQQPNNMPEVWIADFGPVRFFSSEFVQEVR
jgi:hypothetical protein